MKEGIKTTFLDMLSVFQALTFYEDIGNFRYCPTGEMHQTVTSAGIKSEDEQIKGFETEKEALDAWENTIKKIVSDVDDKSIVYWRRMPEIRFLHSYLGRSFPSSMRMIRSWWMKLSLAIMII